MINSKSLIHKNSKISSDVKIGAQTIIEENVTIGEGSEIFSNVIIKKNTVIGKNNKIFHFSVIGKKHINSTFENENSRLIIGNNNIIKEYTIISSGFNNKSTVIGNNNIIMNYVNIGHNCKMQNNIKLENNSFINDHVLIDNFAVIGKNCIVKKFCHIGSYSYISQTTLIKQDVIPYVVINSSPPSPCGLNVKTLQKAGFAVNTINELYKSYKIIYLQGLILSDAIKKIKKLSEKTPEVSLFLNILENTQIGIVR